MVSLGGIALYTVVFLFMVLFVSQYESQLADDEYQAFKPHYPYPYDFIGVYFVLLLAFNYVCPQLCLPSTMFALN
jgi:hypothetical protein